MGQDSFQLCQGGIGLWDDLCSGRDPSPIAGGPVIRHKLSVISDHVYFSSQSGGAKNRDFQIVMKSIQ